MRQLSLKALLNELECPFGSLHEDHRVGRRRKSKRTREERLSIDHRRGMAPVSAYCGPTKLVSGAEPDSPLPVHICFHWLDLTIVSCVQSDRHLYFPMSLDEIEPPTEIWALLSLESYPIYLAQDINIRSSRVPLLRLPVGP